MRAILIGAVESTRIAAEAMLAVRGCNLAAIVTLDAELSGRHSDFADLARTAEAGGTQLIRLRNINDADSLAALGSLGADIVFVIGWSQICGAGFMRLFGDRVVGYHPAALPRLRGRAAIPWTILQAEPITAGTLFWIDEGVDSGPIIDQHFFHVAADETAASLYAKHMAALQVMLGRSLPRLAAGERPRQVQDERHATWAAARTPRQGLIDWRKPACEIQRLVRAVGRPYPGAHSLHAGAALTIWSAQVSPDGSRHAATPGQVVAMTKAGFTVACGNGEAIDVLEWASAATRPMRVHAFLGD